MKIRPFLACLLKFLHSLKQTCTCYSFKKNMKNIIYLLVLLKLVQSQSEKFPPTNPAIPVWFSRFCPLAINAQPWFFNFSGKRGYCMESSSYTLLGRAKGLLIRSIRYSSMQHFKYKPSNLIDLIQHHTPAKESIECNEKS